MSSDTKPQFKFEETDHSDVTNSTNVRDGDSDNPDIDSDMENEIDAHANPIGDNTENKDNINKVTSDNISKDLNTISDTTTEEKERQLIQRKFVRSNVTRFYNKFKNLIEDSDEETIDFANLDAIMTNLTENLSNLKSLNETFKE